MFIKNINLSKTKLSIKLSWKIVIFKGKLFDKVRQKTFWKKIKFSWKISNISEKNSESNLHENMNILKGKFRVGFSWKYRYYENKNSCRVFMTISNFRKVNSVSIFHENIEPSEGKLSVKFLWKKWVSRKKTRWQILIENIEILAAHLSVTFL